MLISFFRSKMYHSYILVPVLAAIPLVPIFLADVTNEISLGSPLANLIDTFFRGFPILAFVLGMALLMFQSLYVSRICEKHHLHAISSNVPSLIILAFYAGVTYLHFSLTFIIANTLLFVSIDKVLEIYNQTSIRGISYIASACIGIASLLYMEYVLFLFIIYVGQFFFRKFNLREALIPLIGVLTPYFYVLVILYSTDDLPSFLNYFTFWNPLKWTVSLPLAAFWLLISLAIIHAFFISIKTIRQKNHQNIITAALVMALLFQLILRNPLMAGYASLVPGSIIVGAFLVEIKRKWLAELLFSIYLISVIGHHLFLAK